MEICEVAVCLYKQNIIYFFRERNFLQDVAVK